MSEANIGQEEVMEAIKAMKMNTVPGPNGFTPELYKKLKDHLLPHSADLFAACIEENKLPELWAGAKRIVLPKQDKNLSL